MVEKTSEAGGPFGPRVLKALANQVSGQKIIYMDEKGSICKQANGNELLFY